MFNLICFVTLLIILIVLLVKWSNYQGDWFPPAILSIFLLPLITFGLYFTLYDGLQYTFNPEYYVLQDIVNIVNSFK